MVIRRRTPDDDEIVAHDREIVAHNREIVAHDRDIDGNPIMVIGRRKPNDRKIVAIDWPFTGSNGPHFSREFPFKNQCILSSSLNF